MSLILRDHRVLSLRIGRVLISIFLLHSAMLGVGLAAVTSAITGDGSMGTTVTQTQNAYTISGGTITGSNLFHSFGRFSVGTGDQASFTGPPAIANIVSRVTGGEQSVIDGLLRSDIAGANLYLLNPSGVLFGPNASLDVSGSFHVSTADFLRFADGAKFSAHLGQESVLTVASPTAFGFLGNNPAAITILGSSLQGSEGRALSVVGGDITVVGGSLQAPSGRLQLASVASTGEVGFSRIELAPDLQVDSFSRLGRITLSGALLDASGNAGGSVLLRGGRLTVDSASIGASTVNENGANMGIDLHLAEDVIVDNSIILTGSGGHGNAGAIRVEAETVTLTGGSVVGSLAQGSGNGGDITVSTREAVSVSGREGAVSNIVSGTTASSRGNAGAIRVEAETVTLTGGSVVGSLAQGSGNGGDITVSAREAVSVSGREGAVSGIVSFAAGEPGRLALSAPAVTIDGGIVGTPSAAQGGFVGGRAGDTSVRADNLTLGRGGAILSGTFTNSDGGNITIDTERLALTDGARIDSSTRGAGRGGELRVTATDAIEIMGRASGLFSSTEGSGEAGRLFVSAPRLALTDGARIDSSTRGAGRGGDVTVTATDLSLNDSGFIAAGTRGAGDAGDIDVQAGRLTLTGGAQIFNGTFGVGRGGTLTVAADTLSVVGTDSQGFPSGLLSSAEQGSSGDAGSLEVRAGRLTLTGGAQLSTSTRGAGRGGELRVTATDAIEITGRGSGLFTNALFGQGSAGHLSLSAPILTMDEGLIQALVTRDSRGNAGSLEVQVERLMLTGGAQIDSSTRGTGSGGELRVVATDAIEISGRNSEGFRSGLFSSTEGSGPGGDLQVAAPHIQLRDGGIISASSLGTGNAGTIRIQTGDTFLSQNGAVTTEATQAGGGAITLTAGRLVQLIDSEITTSVRGGGGDAGNIDVNAPFILLEGSQLIANAFEGTGGNIRLEAEVFLADPASLVSASSALGIQGTVDIRAPVTSLSGTLAPLPQAFVSAAVLLPARCAARAPGGTYSSLVLGARDGPPFDPSGLLPSPLVLDSRVGADPAGTVESRRSQSTSRFALLHGTDTVFPRLQRELPQSSTPLALTCCDQEVRKRTLATLQKVCEEVSKQGTSLRAP